jgi:hypothetical protein
MLELDKHRDGTDMGTRGGVVCNDTRQLDELLRLSKAVTCAPADNFWELKINIATFSMSLVWVLFGSECNYYKGLCNVYATLGLKEVMAQKK